MDIKKTLKMNFAQISPRICTKLAYRVVFHEKLDLKNPKGINQKLQYLKLNTYYNNPIITQCVDKYRVRNYLDKKGYSHLSALVLSQLYTDSNDIGKIWEKLPSRFVIKCNHGCGYNILITDKEKEDIEAIKTQLHKWLQEDFWKVYCETQYKFVQKGFFVEEYLSDDIVTYKFYCFNGVPKVLYISSNGENGEKDMYVDFFDMDWNHLPISLYSHLHTDKIYTIPENFEDMKRIASDLAKDFPFVRLDLYGIQEKTYFSEFTFIPTGGMMRLEPENIINEWGEWLKI